MNYDTMTIESLANECFEQSGYKINKSDLESRIKHLCEKYHQDKLKNESLHLVSESDIKDVTEKWVKSMLHSDEIKEDDCRYNFNHGVRIGIELSKKANSH